MVVVVVVVVVVMMVDVISAGDIQTTKLVGEGAGNRLGQSAGPSVSLNTHRPAAVV